MVGQARCSSFSEYAVACYVLTSCPVFPSIVRWLRRDAFHCSHDDCCCTLAIACHRCCLASASLSKSSADPTTRSFFHIPGHVSERRAAEDSNPRWSPAWLEGKSADLVRRPEGVWVRQDRMRELSLVLQMCRTVRQLVSLVFLSILGLALILPQ
jgi:hypothetical protein